MPHEEVQSVLPLQRGTVLANQFRIEGPIGEGPVAYVHRAVDVDLNEPVALKVVPTRGQSERVLRALRAEHNAARSLESHRQRVLRVDRPTKCTHEGLEWVLIPMERADSTLREWIEETGSIPDDEKRLERALTLFRHVCRGVEALHEEGLSHQDLKPENLMLMENGGNEKGDYEVKIADFGLARSLRRGGVLSQETKGEGIGTPYYTAPEQILAARQKDVGFEADIYALGAILFELLDGDRPFDGTAERLKVKHRKMAPPDILKEVPGHLKELAHQCLAKDPSDRPEISEVNELLRRESQQVGQHKQAEQVVRLRSLFEEREWEKLEQSLDAWSLDEVSDVLETIDGKDLSRLLQDAAESNSPKSTRALVEANADPDAAGLSGRKLLHRVARMGYTEVAQALLNVVQSVSSTDVRMPKISDQASEATIVTWHKQPGSLVRRGEEIMKVSTFALSTEVESPASGVMTKQFADERDTVKLESIICRVENFSERETFGDV